MEGSGLGPKYNPDICLQGLKKTTKHVNQDRRYPSRYLNPKPPEYEDVCTQPSILRISTKQGLRYSDKIFEFQFKTSDLYYGVCKLSVWSK